MRQIKGETAAKKKKKSISARIAIFLCVLLLLPIVLAGLLYLYVNVSDFEYDDPRQVVSQSVPMSFSQRNSFDAVEGTRTMRLDNADLYYVTNDIMPELSFSESIFISAYRIALEDKAIYIKGRAYGINIPIKLTFEAGWSSGSLLIRIQDAYLGKLLLPIPLHLIAERYGINLEYSLPLNDNPLLKQAKEILLEDGYMKVIYPVDKNIAAEGIAAWLYLKPALLYQQGEDEMLMLVNDLQKHRTEEDYKSELLQKFMGKLEKEPDAYQELKVQMLAAAPEKAVNSFFAMKEYSPENLARFYPGISKQAVEQLKEQTYYERNYLFLKKYAFDIDEQFGKAAITIRKGSFVDKKSGKKLDIGSMYGDMPELDNVFPEGTKLCAVFCLGADSQQRIGRINQGCGTAVQFLNGRCAVICKKDNSLYFTEISPEEYADLESGKSVGYITEIKDNPRSR